jgi:hypothetical protein
MSTKVQTAPVHSSVSDCHSEISPGHKNDLARELGHEESVESFARQFTHLEWKYLCSYQWFLKDFASAVEKDDFSLLRTKAERMLVRARLRRSKNRVTDELTICHSRKWYD